MFEGKVIWFWGLSGSGKTTLADALEKELNGEITTHDSPGKLGKAFGYSVQRLDGDIVRKDLTRDLGFSMMDRFENIRRIAFVAKMLSEHGVCVIASFITPLKAMRYFLNYYLGDKLILIKCACSIEECIKRDTKGLYEKALNGEINNMTGIDSPFEEDFAPSHSILQGRYTVSTRYWSIKRCIQHIIKYLTGEGM